MPDKLPLFLIALLLGSSALAQDVPPPPRPVDSPYAAPPAVTGRGRGGSTLSPEANARQLQQMLDAIGRVTWTNTTHNTQTNATTGPVQAWETVTRATVNAGTCELRVSWNSWDGGDSGGTFFLENIHNITVEPSDAYNNRTHPGIQYTMSPTPYSVAFDGGTDFKLRDQPTASQFAAVLRQLTQQCRIAPSATGSGPGPDETFGFIVDRLNGQGSVNWLSTLQNSLTGSANAPVQMTFQAWNAAVPTRTCLLNFHEKVTAGGKATYDSDVELSFRRVEKIEVRGLQDSVNASQARQGHPELTESISPATYYHLIVTDTAGRLTYFTFADQDLANRVAKAMLHATELCGGGQSPF